MESACHTSEGMGAEIKIKIFVHRDRHLSIGSPPRGSRSRLHDLLQRRTVTNNQGRSLELQKLSFLELRKKPADRFTRRPDDLSDLFVRKSQFHLHATVVSVCRFRRP